MMRLHRVMACVVTLLAAVILIRSGSASARAAPHPARPAASRLAAVVSETAKVTLDETSFAGPGFSGTEIAWAGTGTDTAHHLNIRTGTDGLHFPNKTTLPETSPDSPAITQVVDHGPLPPLVLAWTGTDPRHSLNVQIVPSGTKLTLPETSIAAPSIAFVSNPTGSPNTVLLAWTGTDANHSLNVLPITTTEPLTPGTKTVLSQFSSDAGPSVEGNLNSAGVDVLSWTTRATQQLNLATSTDGVHFTSALGSGLPQTSANAPRFIQPGSSSSGCIAWTGTDPAHHLNVQCTTQFPQFPDPAHTKTVLPETAVGAPGFDSAAIAWTGTDPAHLLNVALLQGL